MNHKVNKIIAVDDKLINVRQALRDEGYQIADLSQSLETAAAIVVSGMDDNLVGQQDIKTKVPIIDATGRTADEVVREVSEKIKLQR